MFVENVDINFHVIFLNLVYYYLIIDENSKLYKDNENIKKKPKIFDKISEIVN